MVERICPSCDRGNSSDHAYCSACGTPLEQSLTSRRAAGLARRPFALPVRWKQTGKVVALGVATVAAEVGIALLNRHQQPAGTGIVKASQPGGNPSAVQAARVIAFGRRVSETWVGGQLQHRTEEQVVWMQPEERR